MRSIATNVVTTTTLTLYRGAAEDASAERGTRSQTTRVDGYLMRLWRRNRLRVSEGL